MCKRCSLCSPTCYEFFIFPCLDASRISGKLFSVTTELRTMFTTRPAEEEWGQWRKARCWNKTSVPALRSCQTCASENNRDVAVESQRPGSVFPSKTMGIYICDYIYIFIYLFIYFFFTEGKSQDLRENIKILTELATFDFYFPDIRNVVICMFWGLVETSTTPQSHLFLTLDAPNYSKE